MCSVCIMQAIYMFTVFSFHAGHLYEGDPPSTTTDTCMGASVPLTSPEASMCIRNTCNACY